MSEISTVYFRLPEQDHYVRLEQRHGKPLALESLHELDGRKGFVFAPFVPSDECPVMLMQPDTSTIASLNDCTLPGSDAIGNKSDKPLRTDGRQRYAHDFAAFHGLIVQGGCDKIVLSRTADVPLRPGTSPLSLFQRACKLYPHQCIALVDMPEVGTWLMATPEVLLASEHGTCRTMALAGTQKAPGTYRFGDEVAWSAKNRREQRYVANYIHDLLQRHASHVIQTPPHTTRAARLLRLCTDFRFNLPGGTGLGTLLEALHPTPAVCGMPKERAQQFILHNESEPRAYYSGFCGPLDMAGQTHLFVNLRCMNLRGDTCRLYAGGGIVAESKEEDEWNETELKLNTMRDVLR